MIPIYLEMKAFGPYAGVEIVDFRRLKDHKLFLIYGPTGSGKTTILDAICYALYGSTSGDIRTGSYMRSEYATPDEPTSVSFRFAIGQKYYRIDRSPEQQIAKKRGDGLKKASAQAALYETDEDGADEKLLAAKNVNAAVEGLLGFKADQFRQVVLLPQGDFRKLLLANSGERQQIMQTLFHTQSYARLQALAKERHDELEKRHEQVARDREQCLLNLGVDDEGKLSEREQEFRDQEVSVSEKWHKAEAERSARQKDFQAAQALEAHWKLWEQKRQEAANLDGQAGVFQDKRNKIDVLRKAEVLAEPCRHLDELEREGKAAAKAADKANEAAQQAAVDLKAANEKMEKLSKQEGAYKAAGEERIKLTNLKGKADSYYDQCQQVQKLRSEAMAAEQAWKKAKGETESGKKDLEKARVALSALSEKAVLAEQVKQQCRTLEERVAREKEAAALAFQKSDSQKQWQQLQQSLEKAAQKARNDRVDYESVRTSFLQAQAAVLASELIDGKPCPVCGATDHPTPAIPPEDLPTRDDVERRQKAAETSEQERQKLEVDTKAAETAYKALEGQYDHLRQQYPQDVSLKELEAELKAAQKTQADLEKALAQGGNLRKAVSDGETKLSQWEAAEEAARKALEEAKTRAVKAGETQAHLEAELPEAYRNPKELSRRLAELTQHLKDYEEALQKSRDHLVSCERQGAQRQEEARSLTQQVLTLRSRFKQDYNDLGQRVLAAGFASVRACRDMQPSVKDIPVLEAEVRQYETKLQQVRGQLEQEKSAIDGKPRPDVPALGKNLAEAEKTSRDLAEERGRLSATFSQWQQEKKKLLALGQDEADLVEAYKTVGAVYDLIAGKQTGINFERYVLGALLDDVLAAANERLQAMSRQRYTLQRSQSWDDKRVKQIGLDIEVYDNYTGYARPANTLSGGETFLSSLSLALGLADVVQAYSGGIHLDAIFIDEGFGTLDSETLDYALKTLASLKSGGRLVGIISHVPELKERIDARLAIHKTDRGSTSSFEFS
ncbi:MAG: SMC family ATPase [Megasphaera massiliensis]|uniref:AAA family ATPase n=1 Tax=Megasphaera massiliensis TaxID=1232428 RepID=UPI002108D714|nr:SMC family ATPase [Megasphaera massiliensis]MCQ5210567.1 SMC family ATPase [Megasphaera massiliensis]MEE0657924.1 SMC family ATPase [Megasphaera massiliensis]